MTNKLWQNWENLQTPEKNVGPSEDTVTKVVENLDKIVPPNRNLDYKKVRENLVRQIREYSEKSKTDWFVVWISGWVDSWVVSSLCAETWKPTILITLPIHQNKDEIKRADKHIENLKEKYENVESININLTETFETMKKALPEIEDEEVVRYMAYVNTRSRLRAVSLYAIANEKNMLVVGTGNKIEDYWIWFFTKFGDGAVDFSPIWELYKSEVYNLAKELGIIDEIQKAKPTDWLHPTWATDEDQIWCSYPELEWALEEYDKWKKAEDFTWRAKEVMEIYTKRHIQNAHKMEMPPIFKI